jgi:cell division protein FtsX
MEQNFENKLDIKSKLTDLLNENRLKIFTLIAIAILIIISITYFHYNNVKKNELIAEKYIQAGLYLSSNKADKAKKLYIDIILEKNDFYSVLALNTIIEKNLISDKDRILEFFQNIEKLSLTKNRSDLLMFKKSLYLLKNSDEQAGIRLLKKLVDDNSSLKPIAEELLAK